MFSKINKKYIYCIYYKNNDIGKCYYKYGYRYIINNISCGMFNDVFKILWMSKYLKV